MVSQYAYFKQSVFLFAMISDMTFSILFWNIWLDNQINGEENSKKLLVELKRLIERYKPDSIAHPRI